MVVERFYVRSIALGVVFLSTIIFLFSGNLPLSDLFYRVYGPGQFQFLIYLLLNGVILGGLLGLCEGNKLTAAISLVIINIIGILYSRYMDVTLIKSTSESLWATLPSLIVLNYAVLLSKHIYSEVCEK
ncbi:MAG: hypothetical protein QMC87_06190 [Methanothermobacter thermautotrophicus]|nr:hypothetical protein [Methanothermobacter thermautotrophicus]